ncbi:MAG: TetR/AcrR family transcriptional regulator [Spirochaetes bacterium]|nr:TetR/AcrR family transcriptional regulator [Spirochaetota bacterium]
MARVDREKRILETALRLFAQYGYKKTTIEDVAGELGMTPGNIYFYVKNKKDLYEKTVGNALRHWRDSIAEAVLMEQGAKEKFRVMAERSFQYLRDNQELLAVISRDPDIFTVTPGEDRFYDINVGARGILRNILTQGVREKTFHAMDIEGATEFLFSVYMMLLIKAYVKPEGEGITTMFREGLKIISQGLGK